MGRPRIHPRKLYRALDSGWVVDKETGYEIIYKKHDTLPDTRFEVPLSVQERMARRLTAQGTFERIDGPDEIERVTDSPTSVQ